MILLTGGAGFIGSNVLAQLNERGRYDIVICDHLGSGPKWKNIGTAKFLDFIMPEDVSTFRERHGRDIEVVIHLGANSSTTSVDGDSVFRTNLRASMDHWLWCSNNGVKLIYASSAATYGDGIRGFSDDEDLSHLSSLQPLNLYGWSKHAFDIWAKQRDLEKRRPPSWYGLKFFNVYGPREGHKGSMMSLIPKIHPLIRAGQPVQLFASADPRYEDGCQRRDFVYVGDCAEVVCWLLSGNAESGIYNLGTGQARTFNDLARAVGRALGHEITIQYIPTPDAIAKNYQYFTQADISKLRRQGYARDFVSLEAGVADYVAHLSRVL